MRRRFAVLAVLACVSLFPQQTQSQVPCGREVDRIYWSGCGPGRVIVGEVYTDCDGSSSSWGTTSDFEERYITNCCTGSTRHTFWECGYQVSNLDTCIC